MNARVRWKRRRKRRRIPPIVWFLFVAIGFGAGFGANKARHFYKRVKEKRLIEDARAFLDAGEYRSAALKARNVLQVDPANLDASRIMAEVLEAARMRESILWRRRLTELSPEDPGQRIAWASSALSFGEASMASEALGTFKESTRKTAPYHVLAGSIAMAQGKTAEAEAHFAEAVKLEPHNIQSKLALANVRLQSADAQVREAALATLEKLLPDAKWGQAARRILIADASRNGRMLRAMDQATALQADPKATFSDRLIYLNLLHLSPSPKFATELEAIQQRAKDNPGELFDLISWMNANKLALVAIEWSKTLPADVLTRPPVPLAVGEAYSILPDWPGLQAFASKGDWDSMEFARCALLALAYRKQGGELDSNTQWTSAVRAAQGRPEALIALARLSSAWGWQSETEDLLWTIADGTFPPEWVLAALRKNYIQRRDTRGLYRLMKRELALNPKDPLAQNRVTFLSLLLGDNLENACKTAEALYRKSPGNSAIASTYAFALHLQKQDKQALEVMEKLKPEELRDPDIAVYYALLLTSTGQVEKARKFLKLGETSKLLPEEQMLVDQAMAMLNAP